MYNLLVEFMNNKESLCFSLNTVIKKKHTKILGDNFKVIKLSFVVKQEISNIIKRKN